MIYKIPNPRRLRWLATGLPLAALSAFGQAQSAPAASNDDVVVLSPFEVQSTSEEGYYTPQAVSGTRTRTELINLPMNLTVFNENFIQDIGARDLVDIVSFASGVSGGGTAASDLANGDTLGFILRGQGGFVPNRNGFRRLRVVDPATISRVEILKGPSSVLYGQASPGGSVNYITKRPVQRRIANTSLQVGSYDFYKASVDLNVPTANNTMAFRFVGAYQENDSWMDRVNVEQTTLYPSMTWWIRPETTLTVEFEQTKRNQDNPVTSLPFHNLLDWDVPGAYGAVDEGWNNRHPNDFFDTTMQAFTVEFVHKFNENFTVRANWSDVDWDDNRFTNDAPQGVLSNPDGTPTDPLMLNGRQVNRSARGSFDRYRQIELLNNFEWGAIKVQNLIGYQNGAEKFVQILDTLPPARDNVQWNLEDPSTWILSTQTPGGIRPNTGFHARNRLNSGYFVNQMTFLDGKLHTLAGVRLDKIEADILQNPSGPTPTQVYNEYPSKISPQYGVLYKLTDRVSAFASYSTSIVNLYTTQARYPDGTYFTPVPGSGEGWDAGLKTDMFGGKLSGVVSIYQLHEQDIIRQLAQVTVNGETFTPSLQSGKNSSSGVELDLAYRPTKRTQIGVGYAYTYAYVESDVAASAVVNGVRMLTRENHQLAYSPRHQISGNIRQDLGGFGFFTNTYLLGNGKWVDKRQHTESWFVHNGGLVPPWMLDAHAVVNVGIGAEFNLGDARCNASLMLKNALDERYLSSRSFFGAPRTLEFTVRANF